MTNKSPIARKLMALIVAFSAAITLITTGAQLFLDYRKDLTGIREQVEALKTTQMDSLSRCVWTYDAQGIQTIINSAVNIKDIEYLSVQINNKYFWSGGELVSNKTIETTVPIHFRDGQIDRVIGSLRIVAGLDSVYERLLKKAVFIFMGNGIKTFFVSFFILFLFQRLVTRHLVDLTKYAAEVAAGKTGSPFRLNRKKRADKIPDELERTAAAINLMRENLQQEIRKIKETEEILRASEDDLKDSQRIARLGSWRLDISTNQVTWSDELYKIYGFDPKKPPPPYTEHRKLFTPDSWKTLSTSLAKTVETGIPYDLELQTVREDGSLGWMWVHGETVHDAEGRRIGLKGAAQDITERKRAEEDNKKLAAQLLQAQKMESIGKLAGGIAHDFNNILSAIIGYSELALEKSPEDSPVRGDLAEVLTAGNRARDLIRQILAFARQSKELTEPVRPVDIVLETLKLLRPSTPADIEIKADINSVAMVMANPSQLHQIVLNLCTNGIHSMQQSGGVLEIALKDKRDERSGSFPEEYVELTVTDNGPGIEANTMEKIFEPYFTTKEVGQGTGMGLAMVKGIVEGYEGNIHVESEPGKRTCFRIRLPVISTEEIEVAAVGDSPFISGTERILFVDDEVPIARMASRMLEGLGYDVTVRTGSLEALELFREKPTDFELVITDMTMPDMTGDALAMEMRRIRYDIPVILCTGYSSRINKEGARLAGLNAFVYKPFSKPDLGRAIREVLDGRSSSPGG